MVDKEVDEVDEVDEVAKEVENEADLVVNDQSELVNKDMLIGEIVQQHREAAFVMMRYGLHCIGCAIGAFESLKEGCLAHGMDEETIDKVVEEINELIKENSKKVSEEELSVEKEISQIKKGQ